MDDSYQEVSDPAITVKFTPHVQKAVALLFENENGEVLIGNHSEGFWSVPGGKVEE